MDKQVKFPLVKPLPHELFDSDALKVYFRLRRFHYSSYFVGGCIRDLLLGSTPKDFDIVTSALPNKVRKIFHNSRVIGKRFLLVNVLFDDKTIEVSTFRRTPWKNGAPKSKKALLIKKDNFFGTDKEDVLRRDFTINALYYALDKREVIDYVGGIDDLQWGIIRIIGKPKIRFAEDPIRIIRALKFASRLGFQIESEAYQTILNDSQLLNSSPIARVSLEISKILRGRNSYACFENMAETPVLEIVAPEVNKCWHQNSSGSLWLKKHLQALDLLDQEEQNRISEDTLFAILCWPLLKFKNQQSRPQKRSFEKDLEKMATCLNLSRRILESIKNLASLQYHLEKMDDRVLWPEEVTTKALDFLKIRTLSGEIPEKIYDFWSVSCER